MKNLSEKILHSKADEIMRKTYKIQNIIQTIHEALIYCSDNTNECAHVLDIFGYLNPEIDLLLDMQDELSTDILSLYVEV